MISKEDIQKLFDFFDSVIDTRIDERFKELEIKPIKDIKDSISYHGVPIEELDDLHLIDALKSIQAIFIKRNIL